jgi:hypothetical protein
MAKTDSGVGLAERLQASLERLRQASQRFEMYQHMLSGYDSSPSRDGKAPNRWNLQFACSRTILGSTSTFKKEDGVAVAEMITSLPVDAATTRFEMVDELNKKSVAGQIGFCLHYAATQEEAISRGSDKVLALAVRNLWSHMATQSLNPDLAGSTTVPVESGDSKSVNGADICEVLRITNNIEPSLTVVSERLEANMSLARGGGRNCHDILTVWYQFFYLVVGNKIPDLPSAKPLTKHYIRMLVDNYLGKVPVLATGWATPYARGCSCGDCGMVYRFLEDRTQIVGNFPMSEKASETSASPIRRRRRLGRHPVDQQGRLDHRHNPSRQPAHLAHDQEPQFAREEPANVETPSEAHLGCPKEDGQRSEGQEEPGRVCWTGAVQGHQDLRSRGG